MQREIEVKFTGFLSVEDFINKSSLRYIECISTEEQINLYYSTFTSPQLLTDLGNKINYQRQIEEFIQKTQGFTYSPRIRVISKEGVITESFLVIKGSLKDVVNGTNRMELNLAVDNYEELDEYMSSVFGVESKWDRTRNTYEASNIFSAKSIARCALDLSIKPHLYITIDMNSGYGLVGEVEVNPELIKDELLDENFLWLEDEIGRFIEGGKCKILPTEEVNEWYKVYCSMWERFYKTGKTFADFEDTKYLLERV